MKDQTGTWETHCGVGSGRQADRGINNSVCGREWESDGLIVVMKRGAERERDDCVSSPKGERSESTARGAKGPQRRTCGVRKVTS